MAFDLDKEELRATRKMNKADRNEIEVNDYVRTDKGKITKIVGIDEFIDSTTFYETEDNPGYMDLCNKNIVKHSKQLIDLIEVKDLVCFKNKLQNSLENEEMIIHIFDNDTLEEVKQAIEKGEIELLEILTHEQFKKSSYKVGGEDE